MKWKYSWGERETFSIPKWRAATPCWPPVIVPLHGISLTVADLEKKKNSWTFELKEKIGNAKRIKISYSLWGRLWTAGWNGIWWKSSSSFFRNESGRASCPVGLHNEMLTTDHTPSSRPKRRCPKCRIMTAGHSLSPSWTPTRNLLCPAKERETLCSSNNGVPHTTTTTTLIHWTTYSRHRFFFVCLSPFVRTEEENKSDSLTKWWKGRRKKNFTFDSKWPDFWTRV